MGIDLKEHTIGINLDDADPDAIVSCGKAVPQPGPRLRLAHMLCLVGRIERLRGVWELVTSGRGKNIQAHAQTFCPLGTVANQQAFTPCASSFNTVAMMKVPNHW
jgi:hypothetical protein